MKKQYMTPETDYVRLRTSKGMMAGLDFDLDDILGISTENVIDAKEMNLSIDEDPDEGENASDSVIWLWDFKPWS